MVTLQAQAIALTGGTTLSFSKASLSLADGDFLVVSVGKDGSRGPLSGPAAWTALAQGAGGVSTGGSGLRYAVWSHLITDLSAEPASWAFGSPFSNVHAGVLSAWRDCDQTTPMDAFLFTFDNAGEPTNRTAPSITTTVANALIVVGIGNTGWTGTPPFAAPSGYTLVNNGTGFNGTGNWDEMAYQQLAAAPGVVAPGVWGCVAPSQYMGRFTMALTPVAVPNEGSGQMRRRRAAEDELRMYR